MDSDNKKIILLVEDEKITAMLEKQQLEKKGYIIHHVTSGEKAVETIHKAVLPIDLILMDIDLGPGIDGTQAAEQILSHKDIPVVFLSSHTEPEIVEKTEKITSYGYVVKNSGIVVLDTSIKMAFKLFEANKKLSNELIERKLAEEKIQAMDVRMWKLFANVPDLIYQFTRRPDGSYYVPIASKGVSNIFGCSPEDVRDNFEPISRVLYPEDAARVIEDIEYSAKHITYFTCEFRVHIPGRDIQWILSRSTPERLPDGSVTWYGFNVDITGRKQMEIQLQKAKDDLQTISDNMLDMVSVTDMQGNFKFVGSSHKILGYEIEYFIGKNVMDFIHPDDLPEVQAKFIDIITNKKLIADAIYKYRCADGSYLWFETFGTLISDNHGNPKEILFNTRDFTDRKLADEALQSTIYELKKSQEAAKVGSWVWHIPQNRVEWSDEMYKIFSINKDLFSGDLTRVINENIHPDDRAEVDRSNASVMEKNNPIPVEFRIVRPDGSIRTVWAEAGELELDAEGKPRLLRGIVHDITERKRMVEKLKDSEARYKALFNNISDAIFIYNPDTFEILQANEATSKLYGYDITELIGLSCLTFSAEQDKSRSVATKILMDGYADVKLRHHKKKDGTDLYVHLTGHKVIVDGQDVLFSVCRDITARLLSEQALFESEAQKKAILNGISTNIAFVDSDLKIIWVNKAAAESIDLESDALCGRYCYELWASQTEPCLNCPTIKAFQTHKTEQGIMRMPNGRYLDTKGEPVFNDNGELAGVVVIAQDITERILAEEEIKKQLTEKETLLREVHHRVKNNIANIEGLLMLQVDSYTNTEVKSALQTAISHITSMRVLYDNLLRTEDYKEVSIKNYIDTLIASITAIIPDSEKITFEKQITDFKLNTNKIITIGIALNEILTNAFKYAFIGRNSGHISVILNKTENHVTLIVHDNGVGLDNDFDLNKSSGFGINILKMFSESCTIENHKGTRVILNFDI